MISKELLIAVLGIPLSHIRYNDTTNLYEIFKEDLFNWSDGSYGRWSNLEVNIYEFAHKCKEWALSKGYIINSGATTSNDWSSTIYKVIKENPYIKELSHTWEQSEPEAIFKACEWILTKDSK